MIYFSRIYSPSSSGYQQRHAFEDTPQTPGILAARSEVSDSCIFSILVSGRHDITSSQKLARSRHHTRQMFLPRILQGSRYSAVVSRIPNHGVSSSYRCISSRDHLPRNKTLENLGRFWERHARHSAARASWMCLGESLHQRIPAPISAKHAPAQSTGAEEVAMP